MSKLPVDADAIRALAEILLDTGLTEIEIAEGDSRIRVKRAPAVMQAAVPAHAAAAPARAAAAPAEEADYAKHPGAVKSPMVGVAYLAPEPGAANFVVPGQTRGRRPDAAADRGDEDVQPDKGAARRHAQSHPGQRRRAGGIRRSADGYRIGMAGPLVGPPLFNKVLIANRGEIALRVQRACRELGIGTVAVHSTADSEAMHVRLADESVCIGPPAARDSYLNMAAILTAASVTGADAIHPGYGFLSENAAFAEMVEAHGLTFIGPSSDHIRMMGDKITARTAMAGLGVPLVPGSPGALADLDAARAIAAQIGYPVLIKATAGGGGRGMKVAHTEDELEEAWRVARTEARAAFGNDEVYLEKYLDRPRHIELQVMADSYGHVVHFGERDCSLQRRHQKLLEEAGSPVLTSAERDAIGATATAALARLGYRNAGTLEFLYQDGQFAFIEMNTRLQVEHPVTEMVCNVDLVREQIRIAAGQALGYTQADVVFSGHAIECRVNAEDPETFLPTPGRVLAFHAPGGLGVRVDSALYAGYVVPPYYDSLVAKLIVHAPTRPEAIARLRRALDEFAVLGIKTTLPLHQRIIEQPAFQAGDYTIHWLEQFVERALSKE